MFLLFLNLLVHTTVFVAIGLLAAKCCQYNAAMRHAVLLASLFAVVLSPLTVLIAAQTSLFVVRIPGVAESTAPVPSSILAVQQAAAARVLIGRPEAAEIPETLADQSHSAATEFDNEFSTQAPRQSADDTILKHRTNSPESAMASKTHTERTAAPYVVPSQKPLESTLLTQANVSLAILLLWGTGVVSGLLRILFSARLLLRIRATAEPVRCSRLSEVFGNIAEQLGVRVIPPILESADISTPLASGLRQPMIILPEGLTDELPELHLRGVLSHELAHIERCDDLVVLLQAIAGLVFWPNVLLHVLNRALSTAREEICDNFGARQTDTVTYSATLLKLAERAQQQSTRRPVFPATVGFFSAKGLLESRVAVLLSEAHSRDTGLGRRTRGATCVGFVLALMVASLSHIAASAKPSAVPTAIAKITVTPETNSPDNPVQSLSQPPAADFAIPDVVGYEVRVDTQLDGWKIRQHGVVQWHIAERGQDGLTISCSPMPVVCWQRDVASTNGAPCPLSGLLTERSECEFTVVPDGSVTDAVSVSRLPWFLGHLASLPMLLSSADENSATLREIQTDRILWSASTGDEKVAAGQAIFHRFGAVRAKERIRFHPGSAGQIDFTRDVSSFATTNGLPIVAWRDSGVIAAAPGVPSQVQFTRDLTLRPGQEEQLALQFVVFFRKLSEVELSSYINRRQRFELSDEPSIPEVVNPFRFYGDSIPGAFDLRH